MIPLSDTDAIIRILVALGVGAAVGLEREWRNKSAGFRTYALVCEGAALFMISSILLYNLVRNSGGLTADPSRIGSTVVQGIGFIAAGVIFAAGTRIHGLTTAAGIWVTSAIGLLIGAGFFTVALVGAGATIATLGLLRYVEHFIPVSPSSHFHDDSAGEEAQNVPSERDRS